MSLLDATTPVTVDVFKIRHNGSIRNVDPTFFDSVRARNDVLLCKNPSFCE